MSQEFEFEENLRCYFFGLNFSKDKMSKSTGLAGFSIPDLGIVFRSKFKGTLFECQYAGLLALLRFIDANNKSFKGIRFEILSDSAVIVFQVTQKKFVSGELVSSFRAVNDFQKKIPFKISWVPEDENVSITGLTEMPSIPSETDLNLEIEIKDKYKELGKGYILF
ncbi:MAG: hypothetical protein JSW64_14210 [Candidatus Zixiibacteriota bacterium]|nr:MAG: hypothetical protein JSW64_14210 [candidate division Zixibacteria bacterium]